MKGIDDIEKKTMYQRDFIKPEEQGQELDKSGLPYLTDRQHSFNETYFDDLNYSQHYYQQKRRTNGYSRNTFGQCF